MRCSCCHQEGNPKPALSILDFSYRLFCETCFDQNAEPAYVVFNMQPSEMLLRVTVLDPRSRRYMPACEWLARQQLRAREFCDA